LVFGNAWTAMVRLTVLREGAPYIVEPINKKWGGEVDIVTK